MFLQNLVSKFPNYQQSLTILPGLPKLFANYDVIFRPCLGYANAINFISETKIPGFLLLPETHSKPQEKASCVLFIPTAGSAGLGKILLIKTVHSASDPKKILSDFQFLKAYLTECLNKDLQDLQTKLAAKRTILSNQQFHIPVEIVLFTSRQQLDKVTKEIARHLQSFFYHCHDIPSSVCHIPFNGRKKPALLHPGGKTTPEIVKNILASIVLDVPVEQIYKLTERKFNCAQLDQFLLGNMQQVLKLYKIYFPSINFRLELLPNLNRICSTLLPKSEKIETGAEEYLGEIKNFWERLLSKLQNPKGLLIYSFEGYFQAYNAFITPIRIKI